MYHLLKGLHEHLTRKDEYSVVIIGLDNVGSFLAVSSCLLRVRPYMACISPLVTVYGSC